MSAVEVDRLLRVFRGSVSAVPTDQLLRAQDIIADELQRRESIGDANKLEPFFGAERAKVWTDERPLSWTITLGTRARTHRLFAVWAHADHAMLRAPCGRSVRIEDVAALNAILNKEPVRRCVRCFGDGRMF